MKSMHNIEYINGRWVGYDSTGQAHRITGDSKHGYTVNGKYVKRLIDASAYLDTLA
jgi:hypothetical protein